MPKERSFIGYSTQFQDICLIYPPLISQVIQTGHEQVLKYASSLTVSQEDLDDQMADSELKISIDPLSYLFLEIAVVDGYEKQIRDAFTFFTHEDKILFLKDQKEIVIGDITEKRLLNRENFFDFQNSIRECMGVPIVEDISQLNPKIREMKAIQRKRDRIKQKQDNVYIDFFSKIVAVCSLGLGITPMNVGNITYMALTSLLSCTQAKDGYDVDIAARLAGASSDGDKTPKNWITLFMENG